MPCIPFNIDGVTGVACTRGSRREKCSTCGSSSNLYCDGCDKPLCAPCSVSHRRNLDFCPECCRELFREWCATEEGKRYASGHRDLRRNAFRAWAKHNPDRFDLLTI